MNKKRNLMMLSVIASVLIATTLPVLGYDRNNPASFKVEYIIPSDTSFTVSVCGNQQTMQFNATNGSSKSVEPVCQVKATNTAWANITNTGNLNLNFSIELNTTNPSWVVLKVGSNPAMSDEIPVTNTSASPAGWLNVGQGNTVELYSLADFTNGPQGTTSNGIKINS